MIPDSIYKNIDRKKILIDNVNIVGGIPLFSWVEINVNDLCNRSCVFCPRGHDYKSTNNHISVDLVQKICNELKFLNFDGIINISGSGECLLTKNIVNIVQLFGDNNLNLEITTNGDKLTVKLIQDLYKAGLNHLIVSMYDGPEQVSYFNTLFSDAKISKDNYILRDRWYSEEDNYGLMLTNRAGYFNSRKINRKCFYPHHAIYIDWDGSVLLCCHDMYKKTVVFGNVNNSTLLDIWNNKQLNKYRKKLNSGDRSLKPCNNCDVDGCVVGEVHAKSW